MKIRSMRWGKDSGGCGCGPIGGLTNVEIMITGDDGHNYFVTDSKMSGDHDITISEVAVFDIIMGATYYDVDFEYEYDKIKSLTTERYEFMDEDGIPEELWESKFAKVLMKLIDTTNKYDDGRIAE